jgi:hypothetical protein
LSGIEERLQAKSIAHSMESPNTKLFLPIGPGSIFDIDQVGLAFIHWTSHEDWNRIMLAGYKFKNRRIK